VTEFRYPEAEDTDVSLQPFYPPGEEPVPLSRGRHFEFVLDNHVSLVHRNLRLIISHIFYQRDHRGKPVEAFAPAYVMLL